jgi:DNA invertase Pin-like site-specific DNA recombinase
MRTAIYARVSTKDQSCDLQLRDLRAYCVARKLTIAHEYVDIGQSGAKDSRPELNVLMADARKRKIDLIIAWRFDRFARSTKHLLLSLEEFRSLGIQFISYQENIDTSSPLGQALFTIISAVAQLEWDLIIDAQNLFCEISKYARVVHPDVAGTSGRTRIKQRFHANPEPLRYWN